MTITVYQLNAFMCDNEGGNPAGVVLNADNLTDEQMQHIAAQVGFSETAFVSAYKNNSSELSNDYEVNDCDFNVRFFTPNTEVDFCGHATLAVYALLYRQNPIEQTFTQQTKAGKLAVTVNEQGYVEMNQALPKFINEISTSEIADTLNIDEKFLSVGNLPIEIVSTGLADIIIPVVYGQLDNIRPDYEKISQLTQQYHTIGYHLFELNQQQNEFTASCRNFAPLVDIEEESATGSASGALACYLSKHYAQNGHLFTQSFQQNSNTEQFHFSFEQGKAMQCRSTIHASVKIADSQFSEVKVGGFAKFIKAINLSS